MAHPATRSLALLLVGFLAAGCDETLQYNVSVNAFAASSASAYHTYIVLPRDAAVDSSDLEFEEYSRYVVAVLRRRGLRRVSDDNPDAQLAVFLGYGVGPPEEHSYTYLQQLYGQTGVASANTTSDVHLYGNSVTAKSKTTYEPRYGVTGYAERTGHYTTFTRHITLNAIDVSQYKRKRLVEVWKTTIVSSGSSGDLRALFPVMLVGASNLIDVNTGQVIERTVDEDSRELAWLRNRIGALPRTAAPEE